MFPSRIRSLDNNSHLYRAQIRFFTRYELQIIFRVLYRASTDRSIRGEEILARK